jgi:uncharacterized protein (DUF1800 family)
LAGCAQLNQGLNKVTGNVAVNLLPLPTDPVKVAMVSRVLARAAFGWRPGDIAEVAAKSPQGWIEEQLKPSKDEAQAVNWRIDGLDTMQYFTEGPEMLYSLSDDQLSREMQQVALVRSIYGQWQLREVMADFWTNHFNIFALKGDERVLLPVDTQRVIREHSMGTFRDILKASATSPAMLIYLDNQANKKGVVNENYARELLELHSLGVHSGYSIQDIREVAKCFTGWGATDGYKPPKMGPFPIMSRGELIFKPELHEDGPKYIKFLDLHVPAGGGKKDIDLVIDSLSVHPAAAKFIATKLCRRFLGTESPAAVEAASSAFLQSKGSIPATLRPILLDYMATGKDCQPIVRKPLDYLAAATRALAVDTNGTEPLQQRLSSMGQPLFHWPMPDGFPEKASSWTGSLLARWNFAVDLASGRIGGSRIPWNELFPNANETPAQRADRLIELILARPAADPEIANVRAAAKARLESNRDPKKPELALASATALILASPQFQWK